MKLHSEAPLNIVYVSSPAVKFSNTICRFNDSAAPAQQKSIQCEVIICSEKGKKSNCAKSKLIHLSAFLFWLSIPFLTQRCEWDARLHSFARSKTIKVLNDELQQYFPPQTDRKIGTSDKAKLNFTSRVIQWKTNFQLFQFTLYVCRKQSESV